MCFIVSEVTEKLEGAVMSLTAASSGLVLVLLTVPGTVHLHLVHLVTHTHTEPTHTGLNESSLS